MGDADRMTDGTATFVTGDWSKSRAAFEAALAENESAEALDGLGLSLWWLKQIPEGLELRTRAYAMYRRAGRLEEAGAIAAWLAREHRSLYRDHALAEGWLARARSAIEHLRDSAVAGWVLLAQAEASSDVDSGIRSASDALAIARRKQDVDLEIQALARLGVFQIARGEVEIGLANIDEAMTAATAGEGRDPQSVGDACCALMEAAELIGDMERVARWGKALKAFKGSGDYGPLSPFGASIYGTLSAFCGACCGGIYLVTGRLDQAESELISAITELESAGMHSRCVHPITQLAELRVVQGRLEEARLLLSSYEDLSESIRPLAVVDLASGSPETAAARLKARIDELSGLEVVALPLWVLLVDAELARGDFDAADRAAGVVGRVASLTKSKRHDGEAMFARGKVQAARRDTRATELLHDAALKLSEASLPLLACRARMHRARALVDTDRGVAISEARASLAAFDRLGASADADEAAAFLRELGVKGRTGPKDIGLLSKREVEVLRLLTEGLSNAEISERLFISAKTAGHHVSNILAKLQLRSRTEAAAYAALHLSRGAAGK